MLVLNLKKRNCIKILETNEIVSVIGVFEGLLVLKIYEGSDEKTHKLLKELKCPAKEEIKLSENLTVKHISGEEKNMKIGFKGNDSVVRMPSKFKVKEKKEPNFDFNFDFDEEDY